MRDGGHCELPLASGGLPGCCFVGGHQAMAQYQSRCPQAGEPVVVLVVVVARGLPVEPVVPAVPAVQAVVVGVAPQQQAGGVGERLGPHSAASLFAV